MIEARRHGVLGEPVLGQPPGEISIALSQVSLSGNPDLRRMVQGGPILLCTLSMVSQVEGCWMEQGARVRDGRSDALESRGVHAVQGS